MGRNNGVITVKQKSLIAAAIGKELALVWKSQVVSLENEPALIYIITKAIARALVKLTQDEVIQ